jgi:transposase-like protein
MKKNTKKMFNGKFNSIVEVMQIFSTEEKCIQHLEELYWQGVPVSPFVESSKVYKCKGGKYKCKESGKYFTVLTGTMFAGTKVSLPLWFCAIYLVISHKKGISSSQLGRDLGVSQKTAWYMLSRIRKCFGIENYNELNDVVEADESFYGGLNKNRHKNKKVPHSQGRACVDKTPILGLLQRNGKLTAIVTKDTSKVSLQPLIKKYVKPNTLFITDDWKGYRNMPEYNHKVVKDYKENVHGNHIHTNNIEGAWKIMKNSLRDMYNSVSRKYLQIYVDEFVFRFNTRQMESGVRFNYLLLNSNKRTKYKDLMNA